MRERVSALDCLVGWVGVGWIGVVWWKKWAGVVGKWVQDVKHGVLGFVNF